jgi:hypothetical protein
VIKRAWNLGEISVGISPVILFIPRNGVSQSFNKFSLFEVSMACFYGSIVDSVRSLPPPSVPSQPVFWRLKSIFGVVFLPCLWESRHFRTSKPPSPYGKPPNSRVSSERLCLSSGCR